MPTHGPPSTERYQCFDLISSNIGPVAGGNGQNPIIIKAYRSGERQLDPARALRYEAADDGEVRSGAERRLRRCRRSRDRDGQGGDEEEEEEEREERQRVRGHGEE
ncbi:hypothetical protein GW17_00005739 [Ensete ventricosum]|nr:hypothetical protein GW17_00005739 [Ensete ventricosum]